MPGVLGGSVDSNCFPLNRDSLNKMRNSLAAVSRKLNNFIDKANIVSDIERDYLEDVNSDVVLLEMDLVQALSENQLLDTEENTDG